jgi:hypothetical protein
MKKHAITLLILTMALSGMLFAQSRTLLKADVPFDFVVNGTTMPAGSCTVSGPGDALTILWINSGSERTHIAPNSSESVRPYETTSLLFHKYGDRYFLSGITREGERRGYELPMGRLEKELRAQNVVETDVTLLAMAK